MAAKPAQPPSVSLTCATQFVNAIVCQSGGTRVNCFSWKNAQCKLGTLSGDPGLNWYQQQVSRYTIEASQLTLAIANRASIWCGVILAVKSKTVMATGLLLFLQFGQHENNHISKQRVALVCADEGIVHSWNRLSTP